MSQTFRIILRDAEGPAGLDSREFDLTVGSTFPIGRSSKNADKRDLMPASHNAYINSPVVSRKHAVLSANAESGTPQVYLADNSSMHGTMVNGKRLEPDTPKQLTPGDLVQFGVDVSRNNEYFIARQYIFNSRLLNNQAPFSFGFTVPDSDGEDIGIAPHHGSQHNPLTFDDSECPSDVSDNEQPDVTVNATAPIIIDDDEHAERPDIHEKVELASEEDCVDKAYIEELNATADIPSDVEVELVVEDDESITSFIDSMDAEDNSEIDTPQDDAEAVSNPGESSFSPIPQPDDLSVPGDQPAQALPAMFAEDVYSHNTSQELPSVGTLYQSHENIWADSLPPPLPPRHMPNTLPVSDQDSPSVSQHSERGWIPSETMYPNYLGTNYGDRPSLFSAAPGMTPSHEFKNATSVLTFAPLASRIQTPPETSTPEVTASTPPPSRRTKVSITEIVEEQPPTPTSVKDMKRKADVLEDSIIEGLDLANSIAPVNKDPAESVSAQTAAIIAQRPKKQPRSILKRVKSTATFVGYSAVGAVGAVALLSYLPDAFFA